MIRAALLATVAFVGLTAAAMWWPDEPAQDPVAVISERRSNDEAPAPPALPAMPTATPGPSAPAPPSRPHAASAPVPDVTVPRVRPQAVDALRQARQHGDPRTPPVARREPRQAPPPEILDDRERYRLYEQGEKMAVYASFVDASKRRIAELESLVAQGEREGLPPEQLAEGRRKLEALKGRREALLERFPDLAPPQ